MFYANHEFHKQELIRYHPNHYNAASTEQFAKIKWRHEEERYASAIENTGQGFCAMGTLDAIRWLVF